MTARRIAGVMFALFACGVGVLSMLGFKVAYGPEENRTPTPLPALTAMSLLDRTTFSQINDWANDHQALRSPLIAMNSAIRLGAFRAPLNRSTIVGRDGYYFYGHAAMVNDFTRAARIESSPGYLRGLLAYLRGLDAWGRATKRQVLFVVPPNKHNIYPEFYNASWTFGGGPSTGEKIDQWLAQHLPRLAVPMTTLLREAKASQQVYYRTDTHWTFTGAKLATDAIIARVAADDPGLRLAPPREYEIGTQIRTNGNFAKLMSLKLKETVPIPRLKGPERAVHDGAFYRRLVPSVLPQKPRHLRLYKSSAPAADARLLFIGDSFMSYMFGFMAERFSTSVFYNPWGYPSDPNLRLPAALVEAIDPQVVVIELVERRIRVCNESSDDEEVGCQGSLVPRLPDYMAEARLSELFGARDAIRTTAAVTPRAETLWSFKLGQALPAGHIAVARITYRGAGAGHLAGAGDKPSAAIAYEKLDADVTADKRVAHMVLDLAAAADGGEIEVSNGLAPTDVDIEVRIVPDDVDLAPFVIEAKSESSAKSG